MEANMTGRIPARTAKLAAAILAASALMAVAAGAASGAMLYNNIPAPLPGNLPSVGFEASQASEFGGQVQFATSTQMKDPTVAVVMSSWACQKGTWNWPKEGKKCETAAGAKFSQPITLNIYAVGAGDEPGALLATVTQTFEIPYRPTASSKCSGPSLGKWFFKGTCFNGKAVVIKAEFLGLTLPAKAIIGVAYNTSDYGAVPQRPQPCNTESGGCPYDSLNVGVREAGEGGPTIGSDPVPADAYINSTTPGNYCGNPGGVGKFALSTGCWTEEQPAFKVYKTVK
jgi:hypothetical protein